MGTCTASQWPQDLHLPAQLGGLDPITPMMPAMLLSCKKEVKPEILISTKKEGSLYSNLINHAVTVSITTDLGESSFAMAMGGSVGGSSEEEG
jgi:hypothetical protein